MEYASIIISISALILSVLGFLRARTISNENQLYNRKLDTYARIMEELDRTIWFMEDISRDVRELSEEQLDKFADKVDEKVYNLDHLVVGGSFYFSEKIYLMMESILDTLYTHDEEKTQTELSPFFEEVIEKSNQLNIAMREELKLKELNKSLYKRLGK